MAGSETEESYVSRMTATRMGGTAKPRSTANDNADKDDEHLHPIMHTSFGAIEGLQNMMQSLATENPALAVETKQLTILEAIYNAIVAIPGVQQNSGLQPIKKD